MIELARVKYPRSSTEHHRAPSPVRDAAQLTTVMFSGAPGRAGAANGAVLLSVTEPEIHRFSALDAILDRDRGGTGILLTGISVERVWRPVFARNSNKILWVRADQYNFSYGYLLVRSEDARYTCSRSVSGVRFVFFQEKQDPCVRKRSA